MVISLLALLACSTEPAQHNDPHVGPTDPTATSPEGGDDGETDGTDGTDSSGTDGGVAHLDPVVLLTRMSLDLRGVRPSLAEIEAVEADPAAVDDFLEAFLADERFGEQVMSHFAPTYLTRVDTHAVTALSFGLYDDATFSRSVGDEPLRLLQYIADMDRPYHEVVTADYTMADNLLASIWPLEFTGEEGSAAGSEDGWRPAVYTDGRPAAGVLTTNSMWWRYRSNGSNANRARANAVSRILLCNDYLGRPIEFDRNVNLLDNDAVNDALQNNPGCAACHSTLDPLASYLWGFYYYVDYSPLDTSSYHPEREQLWRDITGVAPAYYGTPGYDLSDLAFSIASDSRLPECAVEQVFEGLMQRDVSLEDTNDLTDFREDFLNGGLTLRSLYRAVMSSDVYRGASADGVEGDRLADAKLPGPDLLASQLEDLTGYRWTSSSYDMLQTDLYGVRTLAGGVDGVYATRLATEPMATMALVVERLAQAAAWHAVEQDRANPDDPRLFEQVNFTETSRTDPDRIVAQIQGLHLRLFGARVAADGPEVEANQQLFDDLYDATSDPAQAWAGLLSVLLRDPDFLFY